MIHAKFSDKKILSKCSCSGEGVKPDCDFSKLSKSNLLHLVTKLSNTKIICVSANGLFISSFSASLHPITPAAGASISAPPSMPQKEVFVQQTAEAGVSTTPFLTTKNMCLYDDMSCTYNGVQMLFPTTVITSMIIRDSKAKKHNEKLKELMLELEEEDDGCKLNLHGGYRSKDGFLDRPEPSITWLKSEIRMKTMQLLNMAHSNHTQFVVTGWGAVLRAEHAQSVHVHPMAIYAGVYYVAAPKEILEQVGPLNSGGCLRFVDPRAGAAMVQVVRGKNLYGDTFEVCPGAEGGLLVLFPSWLMHEVKPMPPSYKGPRISISFNIVYQP